MMSSRSNISMLSLSFLLLLVGSVNAGDTSTSTSSSTTTAAAATTTTTTTAASTTTTKAAVTTTTTVKPTLTNPAVPTKSVTDEVCYEPEEETSTGKPSVPTTFSKVPGGGSGPAPTGSAPKPSSTVITSGGRAVVPGLALGLLAAVAVL